MVELTKFLEKNFPRSIGSTYIPKEDVFEFIKKCDENNWSIIGIEGFEWEPPSVKPRLDIIADYSAEVGRQNFWLNFKNICNSSAKKFLTQIMQKSTKPNLIFDFSIYPENEWREARNDFFDRFKIAELKHQSAQLSDVDLFEIVREGIYGGFSKTLNRMVIPQERRDLEKLFEELSDSLIE